MKIRPSRPLSVVGAMRDIADYKITRAQADLAPTLAEKAKTMWEWEKKDRPLAREMKEQAVKKGKQDIVATERETLISAKKDMAGIISDAYQKTTTQEEFTDYINTAVTEFKKIPGYEDHVVDKDGNDIIDIAEIKREDAERIWGAFHEDIKKISKPGDVTTTTGFGGVESSVQTPFKPPTEKAPKSWKSTDKTGQEWISTLNADGTVTTKKIEGITGKPTKPPGAGTGAERERATLIAKLPQFETEAKEDPNKLYAQKAIRLDENAKPTVDAFDAPIVLPTFESIAGKRGAPKALMAMGEQWDDAKELQTLLNDPKVAEDLKREIDGGLLSRIKGMVGNKLNKWMAEKGIASDSNTATAIRRMQRLASEERKLFMGVAVTELEIRSALAWMPDAGDSYDAMMNKINLMSQEGEQHFRRYMDVYKDKANMAPYYKAWGLQRFHRQSPDDNWGETPDIQTDAQGRTAQYIGGGKWEEL